MKALNLNEFPLDGLSLIEASAGTGKTYAVANLYLRYLLERGFNVEQILVVTFTEAATQELKDRIRLRIQELRSVFEGAETKDPVLNYLVSQSVTPEKDQLSLRLAERQIDQAQIHTIHGFCQQILKRHALDSNVPLKQALLEDQTQLRKAALEDYWRRYVLSLSAEELQFIVKKWPEPSALQKELAPLLNRSPEHIIPKPADTGLVYWQESFKAYQLWFLKLQEMTLSMIAGVVVLLNDIPLKSNAKKIDWLGQIKAWAEAPIIDYVLPKTGKESLFERFTASRVLTETPKNKATPTHAYFEFLEAHFENRLPEVHALFIAQSYPLVRTLIDEAKQQQNVFSFDDLISRVSEALSFNEGAGNEGTSHTLAATIGAPYHVALIDEFQDTDPAQYHIFNTLFGTNSPKQDARLVLIGDPKQAIYGFRGGDIATYLRAKHNISKHPNGHLFTMDTNWRSSPSMVAAVNAVFELADNAFMAQDIPFQAVKAAKSNVDSLPSQALLISQFEVEKASKGQIESSLAFQCVKQIKHLLSQAKTLRLDDNKTLQHSDIAILVRSGKEGEVIKNALAEHGLSATLDSQASIYHSDEARALYFLLAAVADPKDESALRRCLAEPFFGISDEQILAFNEQASTFAHYMSLFESLHQKWLRSGVLAMIREALKILGVFEFWHQVSAISNGKSSSEKNNSRFWERSLTNWNQLAEILQKQSRSQKGHFALLRWYQDTLSSVLSGQLSSKGDNETKLRLESDAQLIRIITIHKSKGLEYSFVFIPFLFSCRGAMEAWFYNDQDKVSIDLTKAQENLLAADQERLAEDIRLLYVALTRAKYQCYVGTAAYQSNNIQSLGLQKSAWAYLLFKGQVPTKIDDNALKVILENFQTSFPDLVHLEFISEASIDNLELEYAANNEGVADEISFKEVACSQLYSNNLNHSIYDDWRVQSFTGLMNESQRLARTDINSVEKSKAVKKVSIVQNSNEISIFNFPKGSQAGTFLHTLFEHLNFEKGELDAKSSNQYSNLQGFIHTKLGLTRLVEDKQLEEWSGYLTTWLRAVLQAPLVSTLHLSALSADAYFSEMQFYFSVKQFQSVRFNTLLNEHLGTKTTIDFSSFEGHLKGAIDLVFEANKQFYILDYKSNYLGGSPSDYQTGSLAIAMEEHRYDVQYVIYTLALHRFLKQRRKDVYNYQRDFGGVIYLFLRGLNIEQNQAQGTIPDELVSDELVSEKLMPEEAVPSGVYFVKPPAELILALDEAVGRL
jgi:exodeoxyribonuclease V beta subunit